MSKGRTRKTGGASWRQSSRNPLQFFPGIFSPQVFQIHQDSAIVSLVFWIPFDSRVYYSRRAIQKDHQKFDWAIIVTWNKTNSTPSSTNLYFYNTPGCFLDKSALFYRYHKIQHIDVLDRDGISWETGGVWELKIEHDHVSDHLSQSPSSSTVKIWPSFPPSNLRFSIYFRLLLSNSINCVLQYHKKNVEDYTMINTSLSLDGKKLVSALKTRGTREFDYPL